MRQNSSKQLGGDELLDDKLSGCSKDDRLSGCSKESAISTDELQAHDV